MGRVRRLASYNLRLMATIAERRKTFHDLHRSGCFVLPNPWDIGSARYLQHLGFKALATSSAGFAFSRGLPDNSVGREMMLAHIREIVEATEVPVNADFENGFADKPEQVGENVRLCLRTGVAGLSVEDSTGKKNALYDLPHATERIEAAREAVQGSGALLVARAECFLFGRDDIDEVLRRLSAYAEAGADCLYAPGVQSHEHMKRIVEAVAPKPVNMLIGGANGWTIEEAAALGVRRVSVGGALARAAWGGFIRAAKQLSEYGTFEGFEGAAPHAALQEFFSVDSERRTQAVQR
ncbi:MAG: isocitrate lyase/phosphoenolpyruvate mutase family protein [Verrucomicrobia bacterium]|nr:isocitrate lyase/phosphoenolpyruvate mutase family protein [Verrucomicrobiota bacterium]